MIVKIPSLFIHFYKSYKHAWNILFIFIHAIIASVWNSTLEGKLTHITYKRHIIINKLINYYTSVYFLQCKFTTIKPVILSRRHHHKTVSETYICCFWIVMETSDFHRDDFGTFLMLSRSQFYSKCENSYLIVTVFMYRQQMKLSSVKF